MENTQWIKEMKQGMDMIIHACEKNDEWTKCSQCPFHIICGLLDDYAYDCEEEFDTYHPINWDKITKELEEE